MPPSSGIRPVSREALDVWRAQPFATDWEAEADTSVRGLTPELIEALRQIAPRPRRSVLPWVFALAMATVAAAVGASPVAREAVRSWAAERGLVPPPDGAAPGSPSTGSAPRSP
ncbi:MAG TPA: hypothetical protein VHE30_16060 [Polyangiaceae bacterium]|nr:hypothetical protein [Polyangiaceae bacterium]